VRVCVALATKVALEDSSRSQEETARSSPVRFLTTIALVPSLTELMSECCFGKLLGSTQTQSSRSFVLIGVLCRQLNLFGRDGASKQLFSSCVERLASYHIMTSRADVNSFISAVEALAMILVSEEEFEAGSESKHGVSRIYSLSANADFAYSLCNRVNGSAQVIVEQLFTLVGIKEESENSLRALALVCGLLRRVFLALAHDTPIQSDAAARLLEKIQLHFNTCLVKQRFDCAASLVLSVVIYLDRSDAFFTASLPTPQDAVNDMVIEEDSELAPAFSFANILTTLPFFVDIWTSSSDSCGPVAAEVLSILFNKVCKYLLYIYFHFYSVGSNMCVVLLLLHFICQYERTRSLPAIFN